MSGPAFAAVDARRSLAPTLGASPQAMPRPPHKPREWPPSVRDWVSRAFAEDNQIPSVRREELEIKLKQIITEAHVNNRLEEIQWDTYPLPQQFVEQERALYTRNLPSHSTYVMATNGYANGNSVYPGNGYADPARPEHEPVSRKRKSGNDFPDGEDLSPGRRGAKLPKGPTFEERLGVKSKKQEKRDRLKQRANEQLHQNDIAYQEDLERRRQRFQIAKPQSPNIPSRNEVFASIGPVVGRCQTLEKNYFRLNGPAKPEEVRPQAVLERTIKLLKEKWRAERNYGYICDQLKSMRQDLTVQHIKNSFAVEVYELHARIALEKSDLGEYNQCQTQLRALHSMNLGGHPTEFLAYRLLYILLTCNRTAMNELLASLKPEDKKDPAVQHALAVRSALALGNYHRFFKLSLDVPNLGAYLIDMFSKRERLAALTNMCLSYRPHLNIKFITQELGFETHQHTYDFIKEHASADVMSETDESYLLNTKAAYSLINTARANAFKSVDIKGQI